MDEAEMLHVREKRRYQRERCIKCGEMEDNEGESLLKCKDCEIGLHRRCLGGEPSFDEAGDFWCPHCWYRKLAQLEVELREAEKIALQTVRQLIDLADDSEPLRKKSRQNENDEEAKAINTVEMKDEAPPKPPNHL